MPHEQLLQGPSPQNLTLTAIPLALIDIGDQQLRHDPHDDSITELALDIQRHGLLQPIGVRPAAAGRYQLLWGSRRLAAHIRLRLTHIPATIYTNPDHTTRELALVENLQRQQLSLEEECAAVAHLHLTEQRSPDQVAAALGKSRAWVLRRLAIPNLPADLRPHVYDASISIGAAEELAALDDESTRRQLTAEAVQAGWSIHQTRIAVQIYLEAARASDPATHAQLPPRDLLPTLTLHVPCALCHQLRDTRDTTLIRICNDGCPPPQPPPAAAASATDPGDTHGST